MQAIVARVFGGPDVLQLEELEAPTPISTEALVRVRYAGVNPVDCKTRRGGGVAAWVGEPPWVPGWDVAGVVEELGYGVTRFDVGDAVFGMPRFPRRAGAYAQYVAAPSLQWARVPDRLEMVEAVALPLAGLTAWQALFDAARIGPGSRVLVHGGSGGVGHLAVQLAVAAGAHVIATARRRHHELLSELGAAEVVDREKVSIREAADGADVVLDLVGGEETERALDALRTGGTLLAVAEGAGPSVHERAARRDIRVLEPLVEPDGRGLDRITEVEDLRPHVVEVLPLAKAARAHELLEAGGVGGKLVLEVP
jgi:NADPH:quinone reductase-like Zn-dependent oxidoreductase